MRIAILTNLDLASVYALNHLRPLFREHQIGIFFSSAVGQQTSLPNDLSLLKFVEQQIPNQLLFQLAPAQGPIKAEQRVENATSHLLSFQQLAELAQSELVNLNHVNSNQGIAVLRQFAPDLMLSIRFGKILQQPAIDIPKLGTINLHSGLLPEYRGVMATFWAMYHQQSHYGSTIHWIDRATIDTGAVLYRQSHPLNTSKSYLENVLNLYPPACQQLIECINRIESGPDLVAHSQSSQSAYYSFPSQLELDRFREMGFRLIDPDWLMDLYLKFI